MVWKWIFPGVALQPLNSLPSLAHWIPTLPSSQDPVNVLPPHRIGMITSLMNWIRVVKAPPKINLLALKSATELFLDFAPTNRLGCLLSFCFRYFLSLSLSPTSSTAVLSTLTPLVHY